MRAILDVVDFACSQPVVVSSPAAPAKAIAGGCVHAKHYWKEAAGHSFFQRHERKAERKYSGQVPESESDSDEGQDISTKRGKDKGGAVLKLSELLKGVKLYELLGVPEAASQDEIKKAYRAAALTSHPDKLASNDEAEAKLIQENFVKIQEAYEVLSDPGKRMAYDSTLPFDDSLPKYKQDNGDNFFELFSAAFARNARFSSRRPVPDLGGPETPMNEVKRFYNFWYGFSSWRDPIALAQADGVDIFDLEDAECREEKRWMMRENQRCAKRYKQAEKDRINKLVSLAEANDPRIRAELELKKAARAAEVARRDAENNAMRLRLEEAERVKREVEEAAAKEEAEKRRQERVEKDRLKAELKKSRQRLRAFYPAVQQYVMLEQLNEVCLQLEQDGLEQLSKEVELALGGAKKAAALIKDSSNLNAIQSTVVERTVAILYKAIESLGLKAVPPKPEDCGSTEVSDPEERKQFDEERRMKEEKRREEAAERAVIEAEAKRLASETAAEERRKREEQRKKEEAAADVKRKQIEKKEREKAKKAEEKAKKQEEQDILKREQQREEAKLRALEQAQRDIEVSKQMLMEREVERIAALFEADRVERLDALVKNTDEDLATALKERYESDASFRGALYLLAQSTELAGEDVADCLATLVSEVDLVWPLVLNPPPDVKPSNETRNRSKKARTRLRDIASKFFSALPTGSGAVDAEQATAFQRGMTNGEFEWPIWTAEWREDELRKRDIVSSGSATAKEEAASGTSPPASGNKGKKVKEKKEDDDDDLAEILNAIEMAKPTKSKKNKK